MSGGSKFASRMPLSDGSEDDSDDGGGSAIEIDVGDCEILHSHLQNKLAALERYDSSYNEQMHRQTKVEEARTKVQRGLGNDRLLLLQPMPMDVDPRLGFIAAYREGQRRILTETIEALAEVIVGAEQDSSDGVSDEGAESDHSEDGDQ